MEYKLLSECEYTDLTRKVNELLADGWELYGFPLTSVSTWNDTNGEDNITVWYTQALIKTYSRNDEYIGTSSL